MMEYKLWINGEWMDSQGGGVMSVENPAPGQKIAEMVDASRADVDRAVQAAKIAFYDGRWSRLVPGERSKAIWKMADLLEARAEEFARLETENTGKPYKFVSLNADTLFSIDNLRFFASAARDAHGSHAGEFMPGYTSIYRREPVGVVGQIAPWNYPLMMAAWKLGPALAAGCTTVLKPASMTPLTTLLLAEIIAEAGIPPGVVNIVTGRGAGRALVEHPDVRMISVTGSTEVGQSIMRTAADTIKRVHLELGGKAPLIVFADADIELVAAKAALAATINTGQDCTAATRVYVDESILGKVQEALVEAMRATKIGDPFDDETRIGPLISAEQRATVNGFVVRARADGAKVLTGVDVPKDFQQGYYYEPTVIAEADQKSEIIQREVFGPVLT
jgi:betaine-aldehyde dehydrogenase